MKKALIAAGVFVLDAFTVISFYMAFKDIKKAVLWSLPILIGCLLVVIVSLCLQLNSLQKNIQEKEKEANDKNSSHEQAIAEAQDQLQQAEKDKAALEKQIESLIRQNKLQREKILFLKKNWDEINLLFLTAINGARRERFEQAYKLYLYKTNILFDSDKEVY